MNNSNPFDTIQQIAGGYCLPRCLHVVADLGIADVLEDTPLTAKQLASLVNVSPDALARLLRLLSAHGVFESTDNLFSHSMASRLLRSDHPQSMRGFARMFGLSINWRSYEALLDTVKSGQPAVEKTYPGGFWNYFAEHPEDSCIFNEAMAAKAQGQLYGILAAYDFSKFSSFADIGGGRGHLLKAILDSAPAATGVLFDLPHVINEASGLASERLTLQPGDFFKDRFPACEAYLVMEVIHDWANDEAVAILKAIRKAAPSHAKLFLLETIVPDHAGPDWSKTLDIHMLTLLGGRQRTREEYEDLFQATGFSLEQEIETRAGISILEASCI
ncbi:MAG: methyltransferase [Chitinophagaceae bacterium]